MQERRRYGRAPRWPHFDNRGPEFYYDDDRYPEYEQRFNPYSHHGTDFHQPGDIYEDEFESEWEPYREPEPWPEDEFYRHRANMNRFYGDSAHRHSRPFPEDYREEPFGRDSFAYNGNRNGYVRRRY